MTVGSLIIAEANYLIRNGEDRYVWNVSIDPRRFDVDKVKRTLLEERSKWLRPLLAESGLYVLKERFLGKTECHRFTTGEESITFDQGTIVYHAMGFLFVGPDEHIPFEIRKHSREVQYSGKVGYREFVRTRELKGMGVLTLFDGGRIEGRLLQVPDEIISPP